MRHLFLCIALFAALPTAAVYAQTPAQTLGTCLADNTTGKDRKDLARWIFTAMAAHPDMDSLSAVTETEREEASRVFGALFTRLLTESCSEEVRAAVEAGGTSAIEAGFGILGQVAMQELMGNEQVSQAMGGITRYVDVARLEAVLKDQ